MVVVGEPFPLLLVEDANAASISSCKEEEGSEEQNIINCEINNLLHLLLKLCSFIGMGPIIPRPFHYYNIVFPSNWGLRGGSNGRDGYESTGV